MWGGLSQCTMIACSEIRHCIGQQSTNYFKVIPISGLDFRKKPWGQLAPKFLDLVASTNFLVAKNFYLKNPQYKLSTPPYLQREGKGEKPYAKKPLNVVLL